VPRANTTCTSGQDVVEPAVSTVSSARDAGGAISSALKASVAATATADDFSDSPGVFVCDAGAAATSAVLLMSTPLISSARHACGLCSADQMRRLLCVILLCLRPIAWRDSDEISSELAPKRGCS
jgi:hypothetical protein